MGPPGPLQMILLSSVLSSPLSLYILSFFLFFLLSFLPSFFSLTLSPFLPHSSVHGILQARILVWVAISLSREFS